MTCSELKKLMRLYLLRNEEDSTGLREILLQALTNDDARGKGKISREAYEPRQDSEFADVLNDTMAAFDVQTQKEIAAYFGVKQQAVSLWYSQQKMPKKHIETLMGVYAFEPREINILTGVQQ